MKIKRIDLEAFHARLNEATIDVVRRYARGNVKAQTGNIMTKDGLASLQKEGDVAVAKLRQSWESYEDSQRD